MLWQTIDEEAGIHVSPYEFRGNAINTTAVDMGLKRFLVVGPGSNTSDAAFDELDAKGQVVALASPGPYHHMGIPRWKARYPGARLFATSTGVNRIPGQHKGANLTLEPTAALQAMLPDHITVEETPGKHPDLHIVIEGPGGSRTWLTNEIVTNWSSMPASRLFALMFKLFGVGTGLEVNGMAMKLIGAKKQPTGEFLRRLLDEHPPTRLIPSHGEVYDGPDLADRLRTIVDRKL